MRKIVARRRLFALFLVAAIVLVAAVVGGWQNEKGATEMGTTTTTTTTTIALNGVDLTVPAGWDSESFINPSGMAVFRLGSFEFEDRPDDDVGQVAQASMGPNDVLINIVDVTATDPGEGNSYYVPVALPLTVDGSEAMQQQGYSVPAAIIRGFRIDGHNLHVSVAFGSAPPSAAQVAAANAALATLTIT